MKRFIVSAVAFAMAAAALAFGGCEYIERIIGHEHDMTFVAERQATCTEAGNVAYYHCSVCDGNFADEFGGEPLSSVSVRALGHDLDYVAAESSTCTVNGHESYWQCSRCGNMFDDEEGERQLTEEEVLRELAAHTFDADAWQHDGLTHWNECSVCHGHLNAAAHDESGENGACAVCGYIKGANDPVPGNEEDIISADLSIHFIAPTVKASGDSALIKAGNTEVLVDAGPNKGNTQTIKDYIDRYCTDGVLEYVIVTHADGDHILGMIGSSSGGSYNGILYSYDIETLITFDRTNKELLTEAGNPTDYSDYLDAVEYARSQGTAVYTGLECWNNENGARRTYYLDEEQTISLNILYNYYYENDSSDENNYSVCFLLTQQAADGEHNYLFTGDLEEDGEERLVQNNDLPEVDLYKAGHHGSKTSSNNCLLEVIKPKHIAVCCCAGYNQYHSAEENTFPTQAFIDRAGMYTDSIYVTITYEDSDAVPMNGDIVFYYGMAGDEEQGSLKLWCSNNSIKLKDTEWFAENRTWPQGGV